MESQTYRIGDHVSCQPDGAMRAWYGTVQEVSDTAITVLKSNGSIVQVAPGDLRPTKVR